MKREEARNRGLERYHTGKPCKRGHMADRYTRNGTCVDCARNAAKAWRNKERESYNEYHRSYSTRNLHLLEKYLRDINEVWFERRTRQRADLKQATPPWANNGQIRRIYEECVRLSRMMGMEFEVIHYIPLRGKKICGLHTAENLKVVSHNYRQGRKNRFNYSREAKEMLKWLKSRGL